MVCAPANAGGHSKAQMSSIALVAVRTAPSFDPRAPRLAEPGMRRWNRNSAIVGGRRGLADLREIFRAETCMLSGAAEGGARALTPRWPQEARTGHPRS